MSRSAEYNAGAALLDKKIQRVVEQVNTTDGKGLDFVEDEDRIGHLMHAPDCAGPEPNKASNSCTAVVKTTGESQFSERILLLHVCFNGVKFE